MKENVSYWPSKLDKLETAKEWPYAAEFESLRLNCKEITQVISVNLSKLLTCYLI